MVVVPGLFLPLLQLVSVLDVLSHRAGISVALTAAGILAHVWFSRNVRLHVLSTVARVVELFRAAFVVAFIRFLSRVRTDVQLEILESRKRASASRVFALVGLFTSVAPQVSDEFIASVEWLPTASTVFPETDVFVHGDGVATVQVHYERLQHLKLLVAVLPATDKRSTLVHVLFGELGGRWGYGSSQTRLYQQGWASWVKEKALLKERLLGCCRDARSGRGGRDGASYWRERRTGDGIGGRDGVVTLERHLIEAWIFCSGNTGTAWTVKAAGVIILQNREIHLLKLSFFFFCTTAAKKKI